MSTSGGIRADQVLDKCGVRAHESVDEHLAGLDAVGLFDPSTRLRTGSWVFVGRAVDVCQNGHECPTAVGDFENVLLNRILDGIGVERFWRCSGIPFGLCIGGGPRES